MRITHIMSRRAATEPPTAAPVITPTSGRPPGGDPDEFVGVAPPVTEVVVGGSVVVVGGRDELEEGLGRLVKTVEAALGKTEAAPAMILEQILPVLSVCLVSAIFS